VALIVTLQAVGVMVAVSACSEFSMCYCLEQDYAFRMPALVSFYTASVLVETAFADNLLSWIPCYPLMVATFVTTNNNMPHWLFGPLPEKECGSAECAESEPSIHLGLVIAGSVCEAAVGLWRSWHAKRWVTFGTVVATAGFLFLFFLLEQFGLDHLWLHRALAVLTPTTLILTRTVSATTMDSRRRRYYRAPPDMTQATKLDGYAAMPCVALRRA
jgi:multisubunit Na+/H+ antiporter MnhG subunit